MNNSFIIFQNFTEFSSSFLNLTLKTAYPIGEIKLQCKLFFYFQKCKFAEGKTSENKIIFADKRERQKSFNKSAVNLNFDKFIENGFFYNGL